MPFTVFHYPIEWAFSKLDKRLNLPGLIVGSFLPDIEVPFLFIFFKGILPDHYCWDNSLSFSDGFNLPDCNLFNFW